MIVLANDPSITAWGWSIVLIKHGRTRVLEGGCIKTSNQTKKRRIRAADDLVRRLELITTPLIELHEKYKFDWVVSEAPHGSQSASAAKMIGATAGLLSAFVLCNGLPCEWYSEQDAKKHVLGKISATKQETVDAMIRIYGESWATGVKYKDEAVADSLQVFNVAKDKSQALKYAMNS